MLSWRGNLWVVRRVGERWGGGAALGLAPPSKLTEAGQLRADDDDTEEGVEVEQQKRERERERRGYKNERDES
jgi:hypothetical protein